jgi:hypothetical protein
VSALNRWVEHYPVSGIAEPVTELDVLDLGPPVAGLVEHPCRLEHVAADCSASGPEALHVSGVALMNAVVKEIPILITGLTNSFTYFAGWES